MRRRVAYLELEQLLELLLHLAGVAAAAPVAGQPVRVRHHLQQRQLRLEGHSLLRYEATADGQHYPQSSRPPACMRASLGWFKDSHIRLCCLYKLRLDSKPA